MGHRGCLYIGDARHDPVALVRYSMCRVEDPSQFRTGQLPDGRWIMSIDFVRGEVEWCFDDEIHPDNARAVDGGPCGFAPPGVELT